MAEPTATPPRKFEKIRSVTLPLLSLKRGDIAHILMVDKIFMGRELKSESNKEGSQKKDPAHLCFVVNMDTGEEMQMIVPAVLRSTLEEEYPNSAYVARGFEVEHLGKTAKGGKTGDGYNTFRVIEVRVPADLVAALQANQKRAADYKAEVEAAAKKAAEPVSKAPANAAGKV